MIFLILDEYPVFIEYKLQFILQLQHKSQICCCTFRMLCYLLSSQHAYACSVTVTSLSFFVVAFQLLFVSVRRANSISKSNPC